MKNPFSILLLLICLNSNAQNVIISTLKFGELRLYSSLDSINKYLDKKIAIRPLKDESDFIEDTFKTSYKNIPITIGVRCLWDYEKKKGKITLYSISCNDKSIKTKSGIGLGDNKFDVIKKLDGQVLNIRPDESRGKRYSCVILIDTTNQTQLIFYFVDNILISFECAINEMDEC